MPIEDIHEIYFIPWYKRCYPEAPADWLPTVSCLKHARRDPDFADVKKRVKHLHCRCPTCAMLAAKKLRGFNDPNAEKDYLNEVRRHDASKCGWRKMEQKVFAQSRQNPGEVNVLSYDDTETTGFPRNTNRDVKNLGGSRLRVIPFVLTNHATGRNHYIYSVKGRYKKGGNRMCTTLHSVNRAMKHSTHAASRARKLVLIADNCSENKNNTLLAFANDLVMRGWYDEVQLLFGPVGHTHTLVLTRFTPSTTIMLVISSPQRWYSL